MDIASPFKPDVFRVMVVILFPGFLASIPWLYWFFWPSLADVSTWEHFWIPTGTSIVAISLGAGMILEDIGARIEVEHIDPKAWEKCGCSEDEFDSEWSSYLASGCNDEIVAHKYLRSFVTRFKFELSMVPALGSAALALAIAYFKGVGFDAQRTIGLEVVAIALVAYLYSELRKGAVQLHTLRRIIRTASEAKE